MGIRFRKNENIRKVILFIITFVIFTSGVLLFQKIHPMLLEYASSALYQKAYYGANNILRDLIQSEELTYDSIVSIERDADGKVSNLQTDTIKLNQIKTETLARLLVLLRKEEGENIRIPIGNLTKNIFFSGRGPKIRIKLLPVHSIEAKFSNQFTAAGVNQTHHEIMMNITIHAGILYPAHTETKDLQIDLCFAETILVGEVPQFYANVE